MIATGPPRVHCSLVQSCSVYSTGLSAFGPKLDLQRLMARSATDGDDTTLKVRGREITLLDVGAGQWGYVGGRHEPMLQDRSTAPAVSNDPAAP